MNADNKERIKAFVDKFFVIELKRLQEENFHHFSFILIGQAIETLGGFLDDKPLKARSQSMKRFNKCIRRLMPEYYSHINKDNFLYDKLRNQLVHSFSPSGSIYLTNRKKNTEGLRHLQKNNGKLVLVSEDLYEDLLRAINKFYKLLDENKVRVKNVAEIEYQ